MVHTNSASPTSMECCVNFSTGTASDPCKGNLLTLSVADALYAFGDFPDQLPHTRLGLEWAAGLYVCIRMPFTLWGPEGQSRLQQIGPPSDHPQLGLNPVQGSPPSKLYNSALFPSWVFVAGMGGAMWPFVTDICEERLGPLKLIFAFDSTTHLNNMIYAFAFLCVLIRYLLLLDGLPLGRWNPSREFWENSSSINTRGLFIILACSI